MSDRELLELAAKAAGIEVWLDDNGQPWVDGDKFVWNPLDDDGDALRLAVRLELLHSPRVAHEISVERFTRNADKLTATRRAITRAAAEIGRSSAPKEAP